MLDYLVALFDDANDVSWDVAKASHAVLLFRMDQVEIKTYSEIEKIDRGRRANAQRHHFPNLSGQNSKKFNHKNSKSMPCQYYNQGSCHQLKTHESRGVIYRHICSACFNNGKSFPHPENECKNKARKQSKTSKFECSTLEYSNPSHKIGFNMNFDNQRKEIATHKKQAFTWFHRWAAFQKIRPSTSYVDAVKSTKNNFFWPDNKMKNNQVKNVKKSNPFH